MIHVKIWALKKNKFKEEKEKKITFTQTASCVDLQSSGSISNCSMENFGKNVHVVMPCEKNSEREKDVGDVLPPL